MIQQRSSLMDNANRARTRIGAERRMWSSREHVDGLVLVWTDCPVAVHDENDEVARVHATMVDVDGCPGERLSIEIVFGGRYPFKQPSFIVSDELNTETAFIAVSNTLKELLSQWSPATTVELILEMIHVDMQRVIRHRSVSRTDEVAVVEYRGSESGSTGAAGWLVRETAFD